MSSELLAECSLVTGNFMLALRENLEITLGYTEREFSGKKSPNKQAKNPEQQQKLKQKKKLGGGGDDLVL